MRFLTKLCICIVMPLVLVGCLDPGFTEDNYHYEREMKEGRYNKSGRIKLDIKTRIYRDHIQTSLYVQFISEKGETYSEVVQLNSANKVWASFGYQNYGINRFAVGCSFFDEKTWDCELNEGYTDIAYFKSGIKVLSRPNGKFLYLNYDGSGEWTKLEGSSR